MCEFARRVRASRLLLQSVSSATGNSTATLVAAVIDLFVYDANSTPSFVGKVRTVSNPACAGLVRQFQNHRWAQW